MTGVPGYFERIREKSSQRWDQLERDPELAGPWHQLFKQVQSPRHVLSELLQNADDAGATEASVRIEDHVFVFEHNGEDFTEEHFASLCRFGYSNKRSLHTIGFRGIGFKSTFSLGDRVELLSPTLLVTFDRNRFSEPRWLSGNPTTSGNTVVRVAIRDPHREREVEKNLQEWLNSPVSLLFFKNIRRMQIGETKVHWDSLESGPVPNSEWMTLSGREESRFLLIRSDAEPFPEEALTEIRQERMLGAEEDSEFPPCRIEIVLGTEGRLFVVLPTGVETELPFACNAPFIQDPARLKIKDPEISPTNRWLLERAGRLTASAMLHWLERDDILIEERASAYGLLPDICSKDNSLEATCGTTVECAFADAVEMRPILLTHDGDLMLKGQSIILPDEIIDVWSAGEAAVLLDEEARPPLCQHVTSANRKKLVLWHLIDELTKQDVLTAMKNNHMPKPKTWHQLLTLWSYIASEITSYWNRDNINSFHIVPVQGKNVLYAAEEVVRLGERRLLQSEEDWDFLAEHLIVLNQNWSRYLAAQRRQSAGEECTASQEAIEAAYSILSKIGLNDPSDASKTIDRVAAGFFSQEKVHIKECVRLAQIAAKLDATASDSFKFVTRDDYVTGIDHGIILEESGSLQELLPEETVQARVLHAQYGDAFTSCSREEWLHWVSSGHSGLFTFVPLVKTSITIYGRPRIEEEARRRGGYCYIYHYRTSEFVIEDWDFEEICWKHWEELAAEDEHLWAKISDFIFRQREAYWTRSKNARLFQVSTTRSKRVLIEDLLPSWVLRLRDLPCLPDTRGICHKPGDLLRRTPVTEALIEVEPFVRADLDTEKTRPLLELLRVRSTPTGPDRLLERLRALAGIENPPVHEVEKWYRRLDQMAFTCSTDDFQEVRESFQSEKLILAQDGTWATTSGIFLSADEEDVPGAAIVRSSVSDLSLWYKLGVMPRPSVDLAIHWLKGLPSGQTLPQEDAKRVRALLARHAVRIWEECAHWINLAGEWTPKLDLSYSLTMQSLLPWRHLHQWVKQKTADLQNLSHELASNPPFSFLAPLASHVEERFRRDPALLSEPEEKPWLMTLGRELQRVELGAETDTQRVRLAAKTLARTMWQESPELEIIPYINGTPAGTARQVEVVWLDGVLYVERLPKARLAKSVPDELSKAFIRSDIKAALDYSYERPPQDVREYVEQNFKLAPLESIEEEQVHVSAGPVEELPTRPPEITGSTPAEVPPDQTSISEPEEDVETQPGAEVQESGNGHHPVPESEETPALPRSQKPAKLPIIERFALAQGFRKDGDNRFFNEDGSWIGRTSGNRLSWERRTASGDLVCFYYPREVCLEREALQVEADIWSLIDQHPDMYSLILADPEDCPLEITGACLRERLDAGEIRLYPAMYRLAYDHERTTLTER